MVQARFERAPLYFSLTVLIAGAPSVLLGLILSGLNLFTLAHKWKQKKEHNCRMAQARVERAPHCILQNTRIKYGRTP
jgi:hypothetical protein